MMRARWIRLAGACRALASLRRVRSSAGSVGGRADSGGLAMWSPSSACRRHDEHEADRQTIPRLRNVALSGSQESAMLGSHGMVISGHVARSPGESLASQHPAEILI